MGEDESDPVIEAEQNGSYIAPPDLSGPTSIAPPSGGPVDYNEVLRLGGGASGNLLRP